MEGLGPIAAAAAAFVGTHFLLSHPLRKAIVDTVGNAAFLGTYSAVAAATLGWLALAYRAAPAGALLWPVGDGLWATATAVMLLASILLMGSLVRNPALPNPGSPAQVPAAARGVYAVTRHPMMWSFALWGLCHVAVYPVAANVIPRGRDHRSGALERRCKTARKRRSSPTPGPPGKERPAIGRSARSSPARPGSAGSTRTRLPVA